MRGHRNAINDSTGAKFQQANFPAAFGTNSGFPVSDMMWAFHTNILSLSCTVNITVYKVVPTKDSVVWSSCLLEDPLNQDGEYFTDLLTQCLTSAPYPSSVN